MQRRTEKFQAAALVLGWLLISAPNVCSAQSGGPFEITRSTIDGGGGRSSGEQFILTGTIAQADASSASMAGDEFALSGGFWGGILSSVLPDFIFGDGFEPVPAGQSLEEVRRED